MARKQKIRPKLWICSEFFEPYGDKSTGYYMTEIANAAARSHEIAVITAAQKNSGEENDEYEIIRVNNLFKIEHNLFLKAVNHLVLGLKYLFHLSLKVRSVDALFIVTNPSTLLVIASIVTLLKRCNLTVLVYDVFPENYALIKGLRKSSFLYRALVRVFNYGYYSAGTLISIGDDMTSLLRTKLPKYNGDIIKITNWADTDEVIPRKKSNNKIIVDHDLQNKTVFTFAGNIGRLQNIPFLIDTFGQVSSKEAHLLFIGGGALTGYLTDEASENGANVSYAGSYPREDQNDFLNACDIAIVSLAKDMYGLGVPSKAYNIIAAGKPILFIGEEGTEIYEMVKENQIGWMTPPGDKDKLIKTIDYILNNPGEVREKGLAARKLAESTYSKNLILNEYIRHFENILSN